MLDYVKDQKNTDYVLNYMLLALDRASVRRYDTDGRLHIETAHISKANVCPYLGKEIPNAELLGLKPKTVYQLLRDPDELAKAAKSSNNIQLLIKHDPVSANDPKKDLVIGSTGTDAVWNEPYLDNSLVVWDQDAIDGIESSTQKELSAGYYYTADMTPGIYDGVAYDGVMRNIRFNHVALVVEGRAGDDVVVGDSMENLTMNRKKLLSRKAAMAKGAIAVCLSPRLAQDAKFDLITVLADVTSANWKEKKKTVIDWIGKLPVTNFKDKPAMDAGIEDVVKLLDSLDGEELDGGVVQSPDAGNPDQNLEGSKAKTGAGMDDPTAAISALLKGKISDEDLAHVLELIQTPAGDEDENEEVDEFMKKLTGKTNGKKEGSAAGAEGSIDQEIGKGASLNLPAKPAIEAGGKIQESPKVEKAAMDAAILKAKQETKSEVTKQLRDIAEAEKIVKPYIGEVMAQDSAEDVYRLALDHYKIDLEGVHPSAFKAMVKLLPLPGEEGAEKKQRSKMAHDSSNVVKFKERFPTAGKVRQLGN